jgi:hypothetical protein
MAGLSFAKLWVSDPKIADEEDLLLNQMAEGACGVKKAVLLSKYAEFPYPLVEWVCLLAKGEIELDLRSFATISWLGLYLTAA